MDGQTSKCVIPRVYRSETAVRLHCISCKRGGVGAPFTYAERACMQSASHTTPNVRLISPAATGDRKNVVSKNEVNAPAMRAAERTVPLT